jgi:hypothetical protein
MRDHHQPSAPTETPDARVNFGDELDPDNELSGIERAILSGDFDQIRKSRCVSNVHECRFTA